MSIVMKRYSRMAPNAICLMPRKGIGWIILGMTILTILALMVIEVRRILDWQARKASYHKAESFIGDVNISDQSLDIHSRSLPEPEGEDIDYLQTKAPWIFVNDSNTIEALFEEHPHCRGRPYLLILVASAPENFERREAIRKSWAYAESWKLKVSGLKSKTLFLIGRSTTKFLNILLKNENDVTGDILIGKL